MITRPKHNIIQSDNINCNNFIYDDNTKQGTFVLEIGNTSYQYKIGQKLGNGYFGTVRETEEINKSTSAPNLVVKHINLQKEQMPKSLSDDQLTAYMRYHISEIDTELKYNKELYGFSSPKILDRDNQYGHYHLIMLRQQGITADQYITESLEEKYEFCYAILQSIHELHSRNIVHGDITKNNILIHKEDKQLELTANIVDFGASGREGEQKDIGPRNIKLNKDNPDAYKTYKEIITLSRSEDMYNFGYLLLERNFSFLSDIIDDLKNVDPQKRPNASQAMARIFLSQHYFSLEEFEKTSSDRRKIIWNGLSEKQKERLAKNAQDNVEKHQNIYGHILSDTDLTSDFKYTYWCNWINFVCTQYTDTNFILGHLYSFNKAYSTRITTDLRSLIQNQVKTIFKKANSKSAQVQLAWECLLNSERSTLLLSLSEPASFLSNHFLPYQLESFEQSNQDNNDIAKILFDFYKKHKNCIAALESARRQFKIAYPDSIELKHDRGENKNDFFTICCELLNQYEKTHETKKMDACYQDLDQCLEKKVPENDKEIRFKLAMHLAKNKDPEKAYSYSMEVINKDNPSEKDLELLWLTFENLKEKSKNHNKLLIFCTELFSKGKLATIPDQFIAIILAKYFEIVDTPNKAMLEKINKLVATRNKSNISITERNSLGKILLQLEGYNENLTTQFQDLEKELSQMISSSGTYSTLKSKKFYDYILRTNNLLTNCIYPTKLNKLRSMMEKMETYYGYLAMNKFYIVGLECELLHRIIDHKNDALKVLFSEKKSHADKITAMTMLAENCLLGEYNITKKGGERMFFWAFSAWILDKINKGTVNSFKSFLPRLIFDKDQAIPNTQLSAWSKSLTDLEQRLKTFDFSKFKDIFSVWLNLFSTHSTTSDKNNWYLQTAFSEVWRSMSHDGVQAFYAAIKGVTYDHDLIKILIAYFEKQNYLGNQLNRVKVIHLENYDWYSYIKFCTDQKYAPELKKQIHYDTEKTIKILASASTSDKNLTMGIEYFFGLHDKTKNSQFALSYFSKSAAAGSPEGYWWKAKTLLEEKDSRDRSQVSQLFMMAHEKNTSDFIKHSCIFELCTLLKNNSQYNSDIITALKVICKRQLAANQSVSWMTKQLKELPKELWEHFYEMIGDYHFTNNRFDFALREYKKCMPKENEKKLIINEKIAESCFLITRNNKQPFQSLNQQSLFSQAIQLNYLPALFAAAKSTTVDLAIEKYKQFFKAINFTNAEKHHQIIKNAKADLIVKKNLALDEEIQAYATLIGQAECFIMEHAILDAATTGKFKELKNASLPDLIDCDCKETHEKVRLYFTFKDSEYQSKLENLKKKIMQYSQSNLTNHHSTLGFVAMLARISAMHYFGTYQATQKGIIRPLFWAFSAWASDKIRGPAKEFKQYLNPIASKCCHIINKDLSKAFFDLAAEMSKDTFFFSQYKNINDVWYALRKKDPIKAGLTEEMIIPATPVLTLSSNTRGNDPIFILTALGNHLKNPTTQSEECDSMDIKTFLTR